PWTLGFRQFSFHHAVRASTGVQLDGFTAPGLSRHATFPSSFRLQVGPVAPRFHTQPHPCCTGIIQAATRRTRVGKLWPPFLSNRSRPVSTSRGWLRITSALGPCLAIHSSRLANGTLARKMSVLIPRILSNSASRWFTSFSSPLITL